MHKVVFKSYDYSFSFSKKEQQQQKISNVFYMGELTQGSMQIDGWSNQKVFSLEVMVNV